MIHLLTLTWCVRLTMILFYLSHEDEYNDSPWHDADPQHD